MSPSPDALDLSSPMHRFFALLLFALATTACQNTGGWEGNASVSGYGFDFTGATATREDSGAVPANLESVRVDHRFGDVEVLGVEPGEATDWTWIVETWAELPEEAEAWLDTIELLQEDAGNEQRWRLQMPPKPAKGLKGVRSRLVVRVPANVSVTLENLAGASRVTRVEGRVQGTTAGGEAEYADLAGELVAKHLSGNLNVRSVGNARLEVSRGQVQVQRVIGDLTLEATQGGALIRDIGGDVEITHEGGDVELLDAGSVLARGRKGAWKLEGIRGQLDLDIQNGSVTTQLLPLDSQEAADAPDRLFLRASGGPVTLHLPDRTSGQAECTKGNLDLWIHGEREPTLVATHRGELESELPVYAVLPGERRALRLIVGKGDLRVRRGSDAP